jgi:hypothetical protein
VTTLEWLYDLGQIHTDGGDMNLWVVGAAVLVFFLIWLEHVSSGRSL